MSLITLRVEGAITLQEEWLKKILRYQQLGKPGFTSREELSEWFVLREQIVNGEIGLALRDMLVDAVRAHLKQADTADAG